MLQGQLLYHGSQSPVNRDIAKATRASEAHREATDLIWLTSPLEVSSDLVICVCDTNAHARAHWEQRCDPDAVVIQKKKVWKILVMPIGRIPFSRFSHSCS